MTRTRLGGEPRHFRPASGPAGPETARRTVLRMLAGAGVVSLVPSLGCGDKFEPASDLDEAGTRSAADGEAARVSADAASSSVWAKGGTAAMLDKDAYPNPFVEGPSSCGLVVTMTDGPCTTASDLERQDISEAWPGVPIRLALKVVDSGCSPVPGAKVRIWHTNLEGSYSGKTPNNGMCLLKPDYASMNFFRGVQTTDGEGRVSFDTCFPGWYPGRTVHIHIQVVVKGTSSRISQLFFPEEITQAIFASHDDYRTYGQPDTAFAQDGIVAQMSSSERPRHILDVARMTDGAMLASKVVAAV